MICVPRTDFLEKTFCIFDVTKIEHGVFFVTHELKEVKKHTESVRTVRAHVPFL
jgi:hypothetical protein